jgi:nitroreductase
VFKEHSALMSKNTYAKKEAFITYNYHSIEKGFLHKPIRCRFAQKKIIELLSDLKNIDIRQFKEKVQIQAALLNLKNYYEFHENQKQDISDYFSVNDYLWIKNHLIKDYTSNIVEKEHEYFSNSNSNFYDFSTSRHSIRSYSGEKISNSLLKKVVRLANNAPSVCNRQSISVYVLENKEKIDKLVELQGGLKGFSNNLNQIIILMGNLNSFFWIGERNQVYVDGGIYLMNLLYALHYYKIAACPAHWAMPVEADEKMGKLLDLPQSIKIISLIAIGFPEKEFSRTLSLKRDEDENLKIIH